MLDEQDRDLGRQGVDGLEDLLALAFGNAGDRLVEQQHARPAGERQRDLEQAALAVGERMDRLVHDLGEAKARQQRLAFGGDRGVVAERSPPARARAAVHGDGERQRRQRRQRVEQLVDLEGADDAAANPLVRGERGDVVAVEEDGPGGRLENAGEQVDQRRLAGAVRPDQGVAGAALELERDVVGRRQAAEALDERARGEDRRHRFVPAPNHVHGRTKRSRPTSTSTTRNRPSQKFQYCGVHAAIRSCSSLKTIAPKMPP